MKNSIIEEKLFTILLDTPLGKIQAAACDKGLKGLWFIGQKYFPKNTETWLNKPDHPVFISLKNWLDEYFSGNKPKLKIPLAPQGSEFRQSVLKLILDIPYGQTTTYGAMTKRLISEGKKASAQAVGGAVGHNPISLLIPCHRVMGSNGSLTGYAGGIDKKQFLLNLEKTEKERIK